MYQFNFLKRNFKLWFLWHDWLKEPFLWFWSERNQVPIFLYLFEPKRSIIHGRWMEHQRAFKANVKTSNSPILMSGGQSMSSCFQKLAAKKELNTITIKTVNLTLNSPYHNINPLVQVYELFYQNWIPLNLVIRS